MANDGNTGWFASEYLAAISGTPGGGQGSSFVTVVIGPLNLRQDPGLDGAIVSVYEAGATGLSNGNTIDKDNYTWLQVQMDDGNSGYFATDLVSIDGNGGGGGGGTGSPVVTVVNGPLNLRSDAGLSAPIVATYNAGATGVYTGPDGNVYLDGYEWIPVVMDDGNSGIFAAEFISIV